MPKSILLLALFVSSFLPSCIFVVHDDGSISEHHDWSTSSDMVKGSGHAVSETRVVPPFHRIVARDVIDVDVRIGEPQSVTVRTDDNFVSWIETSVDDGELTVRWVPKPSNMGSSTKVPPRVELVVPSLDRVQLDGTGSMHIVGLNGGTLAMQVGGVGEVRAEGSVDKLDLYSSGIGAAQLFGLEARDVDVTLAGTGSARLKVVGRLRANITGTGDVRYRGHPKDVTKSIAGTGSIEAD